MAINNLVVTETEGSKPIPEGLYKAFVREIKEGSGEYGAYVNFIFEISEGEHKGVIKSLMAALKLTRSQSGKNSKLFDVVKAVLQTEPKSGDNIDLYQLVNKRCQILVVDGKEVDGVKYQNIQKVLPNLPQ